MTFRPVPQLSAPLRYRFDVPGPAPVQQDVLVSQDGFQSEPVTDKEADVTFRCATGDYLLLVFGRLSVEQAVDTGRLESRVIANRRPCSPRYSGASKLGFEVLTPEYVTCAIFRQ